uniref:Reverse transcriptase domain-containing protein n=1 Tax=Phytophthora ramorum TaxID=164328 RepID=H3GXR2_PHYRM
MEERSEGMPIGRAPMIEPKTPPITESEIPGDDEVCYHEGGDLFAEDVEKQMAVLPEVATTTDEVTIEDIQVGDPDFNTPEEIDRLRQTIWRRRHLLIGKGNALPPAAVGAVCDIDVGGATPVAQRVRRVAPQFREKLSDLIKSLLSAKMIVPSTSPLVNGLTRLMVYPMPMINDLLEDLDKVLWYCSLDMASGFWVVSMTERARKISAFVTPFGLFEWTRMPFGLKNAPQIYQRLIDSALYGHLRISASHDLSTPIDVFETGEPEPELKPSVLGRCSYIDDILVTATTWDALCEKVERSLDACERWNLSISVVKSFWGQRKVGYLGHQVSADGLEAHPKDLEALSNLPFPLTLRSMQSFLGSLNYYSRFIEDFAIYAAVLYELREADFHEIGRLEKVNPGRQITGGDEIQIQDADSWTRAKIAFTMLKAKIVSTPILKHFDPDRTPVILVYASQERKSGRESSVRRPRGQEVARRRDGGRSEDPRDGYRRDRRHREDDRRREDRYRDDNRRRDDQQYRPRVTLTDALTNIVTALNAGRSADTRGGYPEVYNGGYDDTEEYGPESHSGDDDRYSEGYSDDGYASPEDRGHVAAANDTERRNAAEGTFARADNRRPRASNGQRPYDRDDQRRNSTGRDGRRQYGPCAACGGLTHSAHYCFKRCKMCKQVHDAGKCEAFQELTNLLRAKVEKKDLSPELQELVYGSHLN